MIIYDPGSDLFENVTKIDYKKSTIKLKHYYQFEKRDQKVKPFDLKTLENKKEK